MKSIRLGLVLGLLALLAANPGFAATSTAQQIKQLGTYKSWTAWSGQDANGLMCYISAVPDSWAPQSVGGKPVNRDPIHFLVINRIGLGTKNEVQTLVGYPFGDKANVSATIDGKTYPMVTEGEAAWLAVEADEAGFVAALKAGTTLVVKGVSLRGNVMTDTYSLAGVTAALTEIDKACK